MVYTNRQDSWLSVLTDTGQHLWLIAQEVEVGETGPKNGERLQAIDGVRAERCPVAGAVLFGGNIRAVTAVAAPSGTTVATVGRANIDIN